MNTPDNCYLDKGHDAHDLLAPGESCKACGFVAPVTPEPSQQDKDEAKAVVWHDDWPDHTITEGGGRQAIAMISQAIARARHAGEVAEREKCAKLCEARATQNEDEDDDTTGRFTPNDHRAIEARDIAAAIRSLAPAEKP